MYMYICICILCVSALLRPLPVWSPAAALLDGSGLRHHHGPLTLDTLQKSAKIPLEAVTRYKKKTNFSPFMGLYGAQPVSYIFNYHRFSHHGMMM